MNVVRENEVEECLARNIRECEAYNELKRKFPNPAIRRKIKRELDFLNFYLGDG
jgi:hypothetical protein